MRFVELPNKPKLYDQARSTLGNSLVGTHIMLEVNEEVISSGFDYMLLMYIAQSSLYPSQNSTAQSLRDMPALEVGRVQTS
jgi:hypothetical protein